VSDKRYSRTDEDLQLLVQDAMQYGKASALVKRAAFFFRAEEEDGLLSLDYPKDGSSKLYRNNDTYVPIYTASSEGKMNIQEIFPNAASID